ARRCAGQQPSATEGVPVQVRRRHHLLIRSFDSLLTKGIVVMKGPVLAALALVLSATSAFAQAAGQQPAGQAPARPAQTTPRPAAPAPTSPGQTPPAQAPAPVVLPPQAPFPAGAKAGFVNLQAIAQLTAEGKAAAAKVNALAQKKQTEGAAKAKALQDN